MKVNMPVYVDFPKNFYCRLTVFFFAFVIITCFDNIATIAGEANEPLFDRKAIVQRLVEFNALKARQMNLVAEKKYAKSSTENVKKIDAEINNIYLRTKSMLGGGKEPGFDASVVRVYEQNAADEAAFVALMYIVNWTYDEQTLKRAYDLLLQHHLAREDLHKAFGPALYRVKLHDEMTSFIKSVLIFNPHLEVRGIFALALAKDLILRSEFPLISNLERESLKLEARKYAQLVMDKYADISGESTGKKITLGVQARGILALKVGDPVPELQLARLTGGLDSLSNYLGKVVLVDFWATWCGPCKQEIPHLREFKQEMAGRPIEIISVSVDAAVEDVLDFQEEESMPWVHWFAGAESSVSSDWGVAGFPTYFLIDAQGNLRSKRISFSEDIKSLARQLAKEAEVAFSMAIGKVIAE